MIVVEKGGMLTTIQDQGRFGYEQFGVSPAGPMDMRSFTIANMLVGNQRGAAAMEITIVGPTLRFTKPAVIAITGGDVSPTCNGRAVPMYTAVLIEAGDVLQMGVAATGCRAYLAVAGGFHVPEVMGSRATSLQNKIGGIGGRKLNSGDELSVGIPALALEQIAGRSLTPEKIGAQQPVVLRVLMGPQEDEFTEEGINTFLKSTYQVENDSNRMGYRLAGPAIEHRGDGNIISDGIVTGSIQVPASGLPIVMLAERQTVGGYPKIATVISADLPKIGQCRPGDSIRFQAVSIDEAQQLYRFYLGELDEMARQLKQKRPDSRIHYYRVNFKGSIYQVSVEEMA